MKLRKYSFMLLIFALFITHYGASAKTIDAPPIVDSSRASSLGVGDFFLTEDELPSPWIPYQRSYSPGAHMRLREKFMGGEWASVRIEDSVGASVGIFIGYFPTETEAIYFADPDTFIFSTDVYAETGHTFTEVLQMENSQYSLTGGALYGDGGGFSGHFKHPETPRPFNVFRVGQVLFSYLR